MPQEIISQRLSILSSEYKEVIFSGFSEQTALTYGKYLHLSDNQITVFANGLTLFLLLFLDKYKLIKFIVTECGIKPKDAELTITEIISELPVAMIQVQTESYKKINNETSDELISEQDRISILKQVSDNRLRIFCDIYSKEFIDNLSVKYLLDAKEIDVDFKKIVGDIVLGFYKIEDTVPLLQQELGIDAKMAAVLGADVLDFLSPLFDPNFVVPTEPDKAEDTRDEVPQSISAAEPVTNEGGTVWTPHETTAIASPYVVAPVLPPTVPEIHTMASDANALRTSYQPVAPTEPVYTSEQPVTRQPLSTTPSYATPFEQTPQATIPVAPIEPPRWGS